MADETDDQKLKRYEAVLDAQMREIDRLRAENARLTADGDAHAVLKAIYSDPDASAGERLRAASAAMAFEKPKLSVTASVGQRDRREAWRVYEQWALRRQIIVETRAQPKPGWDAHLVGDDYQPPEGTEMPPVDVEDRPGHGYVVHTNLLPDPKRPRKRYGDVD